jgi:hypothetical protein
LAHEQKAANFPRKYKVSTPRGGKFLLYVWNEDTEEWELDREITREEAAEYGRLK